MRIIKNIANGLFVVLIILILPITLPQFFGYSSYRVLSSSMEPALKVGTLLYVQKVEYSQLHINDIVTFYGNQSQIVTHRIVDKQGENFITKGDHNQNHDIMPLKFSQVIGKVQYSIPYLGYIDQYVLLSILVLVSCLWIYAGIINRRKNVKKLRIVEKS